MKTIKYALIGRLQEIANDFRDDERNSALCGLYADALDCQSRIEQIEDIIELINDEYVEELTEDEYIEITKDNYKEYLGSKVEVSDSDFGTSVTYTLLGYNEHEELKFPIICGLADNLCTYRRARVKKEVMI